MSASSRRDLETELKLTGTPTVLARAFRALKGDTPAPRHTLSVYYDTRDRRLWNRGFTLRLRSEADSHELTLKREGGGLRRGEWTSHLAEPTAHVGLLPPTAPRREIGTVLPEELSPCFVTDVARQKKRITTGGAIVEVSLDEGKVTADDAALPLAELEFELLDGPASDMLRCARALAEAYPLAVETRSKAARGQQLRDDAPPPFSKAARSGLREADGWRGAFATLSAETARHVLANLAAAADGRDPEGVHQLRVGLRRLRSLLTLLPTGFLPSADSLIESAKQALRSLGPARDLDVFLSEMLPPVRTANPEVPGLARLATLAEEHTQTAYDDVGRLIASGPFTLLLVDLLLLAEGQPEVAGSPPPLASSAADLLTKRRRKVLKAGRSFDTLPNEQRHAVRISLKKLRYACDYFQSLYPRSAARPYLSALAEFQDMLGHLNDSVVAPQLADKLAEGDAEGAIGAAVVRGWYSHRLAAVDKRMVAAWRRFAAAPPFWR